MSTNQRNSRAPHSSRSGSSAAQRRPTKGTNAKTSYEKYVALARGAALTGDAIETENYYQHAEHYFRLMKDERTGSGLLEEADSQQDPPGAEGRDQSS